MPHADTAAPHVDDHSAATQPEGVADTATSGPGSIDGTIVIDTSALVADPDVIHAYPGADIVLPMIVIEELDKLKARMDSSAGASARAVIRALDDIRVANDGSTLTTAAPLPNGGTVRIEPNGLRLDRLEPFHLDPNAADHRILAAALGLASDNDKVTVVSCDAAMRLKADTIGLTAADHVVNQTVFSVYDVPGWAQVEVPEELVDDLYATHHVVYDDAVEAAARTGADLTDLKVNEFVHAQAGTKTVLARRTGQGLQRLREKSRVEAWGVNPRNKEQQFAMELLMDTQVPIVALTGRAGTGKTLMALAAALEQTMEPDSPYDRVMILRPMHSIGKQDLGFLPGDVADKVAPWFDAVVDSMVAMSTVPMTHREARDRLEMWVEQGKLTMEPVTFLRGRSLNRHILVTDEVQNLEKADVKTILTRLGEGSKLVACGDPDQCDNPFTSPTANGLTALVDAFRGQPEFGHVALTECERSRIADLAADLL